MTDKTGGTVSVDVHQASIDSDDYMSYVEEPDAFEILEEILTGGRSKAYD